VLLRLVVNTALVLVLFIVGERSLTIKEKGLFGKKFASFTKGKLKYYVLDSKAVEQNSESKPQAEASEQ
jgi:hypothetical protein